MTANSLLVDTNILFYLKDQNSKFHQKSIDFIQQFNGNLFTTSKNLTEYLVATTRNNPSFLTIDEALIDIQEFKSLLIVLYPDQKCFRFFTNLIQSYKPKGKKIHDFEIAAIALANEINQIFTNNESDFNAIKGLNIIIPK